MRTSENSVGRMKSFHGNFLVVLRALTYITMLGGDGLKAASENAVLNANYMRARLGDVLPAANDGFCMHEFVVSLEGLKKETGVECNGRRKIAHRRGHAPADDVFPLDRPRSADV